MSSLSRFKVAWVSIGITVLALCGCNRSAETEPLRVQRSAGVPVAITALVWAPDWPEEMNQIADEFMRRNPDVRVNVQFMIGNSVEENLKPKIATNNLPDLVSVNPNRYTAQLADRGILVELGHTQAWNNMFETLRPEWTSSGQRHYGISGGIAATMIYYNESMFRQAGIKQLPTNFQEFLVLCATLRKAGFVPLMLNGAFPNMLGNGPFSSGFANTINLTDANWKADLASGVLNLDTPAVADIFAKIRLLPQHGFVQPDFLRTGYDDGLKLFTSGGAAMAFQGTWASGVLMHGRGFTTGVMAPPWNPKGRRPVPVIGSETGFAVCRTANQEVAIRFLEFIYGEGFLIQQNKRQNISPLKQVRGTMVNDARVLAYVEQQRTAAVTGGLYYGFLPANTIEMLHPLLQSVIAGDVTPRAAASAFNASVKAEARDRNH